MSDLSDLPEKDWCIRDNLNLSGTPRIIINKSLPIQLPNEVYNYELYVPIVLAPISRSSTFVLSAYTISVGGQDKLGLRIHDLRLVDNEIVSSITFTLRGNKFQLGKFKNEMIRVSDHDMCVGVSYFFRKLYYGGFSTLYADKVLKPKVVSPLREALSSIQKAMTDKITQPPTDEVPDE